MIKTLLKFVVTVAVIGGIVFGLVWLTSSDPTPDFIFNMMVNNEYESHSVNSSFEFSETDLTIRQLISLQLSNSSVIKTKLSEQEEEEKYSDIIALLNGNYEKTVLFLDFASDMILEYHMISAGAIKTTVSLQEQVTKQIDAVVKRARETHEEFSRFVAYSSQTITTKASLNQLFNAYYDNFHLEVQAVTRLAVLLRDYCLSDVYSGVNNKFDYIMKSVITEVASSAINQTARTATTGALFSEFIILQSNLVYYMSSETRQIDLPAVQFVNLYLQCENIGEFLVNEDKAEYILGNGQEGRLQNVYDFLFINQGGI